MMTPTAHQVSASGFEQLQSSQVAEPDLPPHHCSPGSSHAPDIGHAHGAIMLRPSSPAVAFFKVQSFLARRERACQAKITQLEDALGTCEDVVWLDVAMHHPPGVHVLQRLGHLHSSRSLVSSLQIHGSTSHHQPTSQMLLMLLQT